MWEPYREVLPNLRKGNPDTQHNTKEARRNVIAAANSTPVRYPDSPILRKKEERLPVSMGRELKGCLLDPDFSGETYTFSLKM